MPNRRIQNNNPRRSRNMGRNYNSVSYASSIKLGPVAHTVLVALMITVLGLIYLTQAIKATSYSYSSQEVETKIADLSVQLDDLEIENAKLTSVASAGGSTVAKNMDSPDDVAYAN
jgi:hypothetical protein